MDVTLDSYPKLLAHTDSPPGYWAVVRIPAISSSRGWLPAVLVIRSDTLTAGGIFLDPKPWLLAGAGVLVISGVIWLPLAFGLTRSLRRLMQVTGRVAEGDFSVPVPDASRHDELGELGRSVQQMAARLDGHARGQKRFLGDIAHELCSPLARMQASLGILQQRNQQSKPDEGAARYLEKLSASLQQMSDLVNELLSFSKAGIRGAVELKPVALAPLVRRTVEREEVTGCTVELQVPEDLVVLADESLLGRALGNVLRNAHRYAQGAGPVEISAHRQGDQILLSIGDRGPGVPPESLPRLLDPFYRPDEARSREAGGTGLGLAIVKSCVEACGGGVEVANREGGGLCVTIRLAVASES